MTSENDSWLRELLRHIQDEVAGLRSENREQHISTDAKITALDTKVTAALVRQDGHDEWHGENDKHIARRLDGIEGVKRDEATAAAAVAKYKQRFAWVTDVGKDAAKVAAGLAIGVAFGILKGWIQI